MARYNIAKYAPSFIQPVGLLKDNIPQEIYLLAIEVINEHAITNWRKAIAKAELNNFNLHTNSRARRYGQCDYGRRVIQLHSRIMPVAEDHPDYVWYKKEYESTLKHEIAHLIAFHACGHSGHGAVWKKIDQAMGNDGVRCGDGKMFGYEDVATERKDQCVHYQCQDCQYVYKRSKRWSGDRWHIQCKQANLPNAGHLLLIKHPDMTNVQEAKRAWDRKRGVLEVLTRYVPRE